MMEENGNIHMLAIKLEKNKHDGFCESTFGEFLRCGQQPPRS